MLYYFFNLINLKNFIFINFFLLISLIITDFNHFNNTVIIHLLMIFIKYSHALHVNIFNILIFFKKLTL